MARKKIVAGNWKMNMTPSQITIGGRKGKSFEL